MLYKCFLFAGIGLPTCAIASLFWKALGPIGAYIEKIDSTLIDKLQLLDMIITEMGYTILALL